MLPPRAHRHVEIRGMLHCTPVTYTKHEPDEKMIHFPDDSGGDRHKVCSGRDTRTRH